MLVNALRIGLVATACAATIAGCGSSQAGEVRTYAVPAGQQRNTEFTIRARPEGGRWKTVSAYRADVDLRDHSVTAMALLDARGPVEFSITKRDGTMRSARVRPAARGIVPKLSDGGRTATFTLSRPQDVSFEPDGDTHANLHLFVNEVERGSPRRRAPGVLYYGPGVHTIPGRVLEVPANTTVEIAGGAVVRGVLEVKGPNVTIQGHGVINPGPVFDLRENPSTILVEGASNVAIRDVTMLDSAGGGILVSRSRRVVISHVRMISSRIWTDGIDISPASDVLVENCFIRTSDDSIAVYASTPWGVLGDTRNVTVRNSVLWPDVAHPINVGTHGAPGRNDEIEHVLFSDLDVLDHDEPNPQYQGVMAVNAGDDVRVSDVQFDTVRIDHVTVGQLFNVRVFLNGDYNDDPGDGVEGVSFRDVTYAGDADVPSQIHGYSSSRAVDGVTFERVRRDGREVLDAASGNIEVGDDASDVEFRSGSGTVEWDDSSAPIRYRGNWDRLRSKGHFRDGAHATGSRGSSASFSFTGRQARLYGATSPAGGLATVRVDGGPPRLLDTYSSSLRTRQLWFDTGRLRPGRHTVRIEALGAHNRLAVAQRVVLDRVEIDR